MAGFNLVKRLNLKGYFMTRLNLVKRLILKGYFMTRFNLVIGVDFWGKVCYSFNQLLIDCNLVGFLSERNSIDFQFKLLRRFIMSQTQAMKTLNPELESLTLVNRIQLAIIPFIVAYVKRKKEKHLQETGLPSLNKNFFLFDGFSSHLQLIRNVAGKSRALLEIYNFFPNLRWYDLFLPSTWVSAFWESLLNAKAVRNRYRLTKSTLLGALELKGNGARVLELAAGTSQALLETMSLLKSRGIIVHATLVDTDATSLEEARFLARHLGVEDQIETVVQNLVHYLKENYKNKKFDVVEMVGIADYLNEKYLAFVYETSNKILSDGGKFITANICDNPEKDFIHTVIDWPEMFYRDLVHMDQVLRSSGFTPTVFKEPAEVYVIGVAEKA